MSSAFSMDQSEDLVAAGLLDAQQKASALFNEVESLGVVRPGVAETEINESVYALAERMYGINRYWTNSSCVPDAIRWRRTMRTLPI